MLSKNEIKAFSLLPKTITQLAKELEISKVASFKITEKLVKDGLSNKNRQGKEVIVTKEKTIHAQELEEIIRNFPRLPIEELLSNSNLPLISLLDYPLNSEELRQILNITRQWTYKQIKKLSQYGIILKEKEGYRINPIHNKINSFARHYYIYNNNQKIREISEDAQIMWQHGNEILFKTKKDLTNYPTTAVTAFSKYNLPLLGDTKYYYNTKRKLQTSDVILHTILINPQSKTYNAYACLLYEKTKPKNIIKKARIYNLMGHIKDMILFLEKQKSDKKFLPAWDEYKSIAKQYGIR
jgi:predicted transcriptional regulator